MVDDSVREDLDINLDLDLEEPTESNEDAAPFAEIKTDEALSSTSRESTAVTDPKSVDHEKESAGKQLESRPAMEKEIGKTAVPPSPPKQSEDSTQAKAMASVAEKEIRKKTPLPPSPPMQPEGSTRAKVMASVADKEISKTPLPPSPPKQPQPSSRTALSREKSPARKPAASMPNIARSNTSDGKSPGRPAPSSIGNDPHPPYPMLNRIAGREGF
jgi:hypothetical protein